MTFYQNFYPFSKTQSRSCQLIKTSRALVAQSNEHGFEQGKCKPLLYPKPYIQVVTFHSNQGNNIPLQLKKRTLQAQAMSMGELGNRTRRIGRTNSKGFMTVCEILATYANQPSSVRS